MISRNILSHYLGMPCYIARLIANRAMVQSQEGVPLKCFGDGEVSFMMYDEGFPPPLVSLYQNVQKNRYKATHTLYSVDCLQYLNAPP